MTNRLSKFAFTEFIGSYMLVSLSLNSTCQRRSSRKRPKTFGSSASRGGTFTHFASLNLFFQCIVVLRFVCVCVSAWEIYVWVSSIITKTISVDVSNVPLYFSISLSIYMFISLYIYVLVGVDMCVCVCSSCDHGLCGWLRSSRRR